MMKLRLFCSITVLFAFCVLAFLPGCGGGSSGVTVKGKLVLNSAIKLKDNDTAEIVLISDGAGSADAFADLSVQDMSFEFKNVKPGSYKVAITLQEYLGEKLTAAKKQYFTMVNDKFGQEKTTMKYKVTGDSNQSITIDLDKGAVTNN